MLLTKLSPVDVANYIIWKAEQLGSPVTHLKLQKLLYYVIAKYLKDNNELLFNEPIYKWQYGPVVKPVYHQFKLFGNSIISEPVTYLSPESNYSGEGDFIIKFIDPNEVNQIIDKENTLKTVVSKVLNQLIFLSAFDLVEKTHRENAWKDFEKQILKGQELIYSETELKSADI